MSFPSANTSDPVIVIGAGLAGLAAGKVLGEAGRDYLVLEAADRPGGLCRTEVTEGFTFDYTGHLLHLREGASKDLILELVGDRLVEHLRKASVCVEGVLVDYPIQAHFGQLPPPYSSLCLEELLEASEKEVPGGLSFDKWAVERFGKTLAGLFMIPYNTKLYRHPLREMEISWTSWSIPVPSARELLAIGRGEAPPSYGYNATFFYPGEGGIEILPRALARGQEDCILTKSAVTGVDAERRSVTIRNGKKLTFSDLISTIPLPDLLGIADELPDDLVRVAGRLRHSSVLGICMGLDGPLITDNHWIYFPDENLPFYRMGFPTNFSDNVAPEGCGSVYAEVAYTGSSRPDADEVVDQVIRTLDERGLVEPSTRVSARIDLDIPCAYVFHDMYRARHLEDILRLLGDRGIRSVGRYGAWEYSAMQDAVEWGLDAAREVLK